MRIARFYPKARDIDCAVKRDNVIGARADNIRANGRHDPHQQAEDMTAPTIKRNAAKKPLISGRRPDMTNPSLRTSDENSLAVISMVFRSCSLTCQLTRESGTPNLSVRFDEVTRLLGSGRCSTLHRMTTSVSLRGRELLRQDIRKAHRRRMGRLTQPTVPRQSASL